MVLLAATHRINQWLGPWLLQHGLSARYRLGGRIIRPQSWLDQILLLPLAQRLVSIELQEEMHDESKMKLWWKRQQFRTDIAANTDNIDIDDETGWRMHVLSRYLRPVLVPNERWSDVMRWQFQNAFIQWARHEYLKAAYGVQLRVTLDAYTSLQSSRLHRNNTSRSPPPRAAFLKKAFALQSWRASNDKMATARSMQRVADQLPNSELISDHDRHLHVLWAPPDSSTTHLTILDLLEAVGGHVRQCNAFNLLCEQFNIYQCWTHEFVSHLALYLRKRARASNQDTIVLDLGAGDGVLTAYLQDELVLNDVADVAAIVEPRRPRSSRRGSTVPSPRPKHAKPPSATDTSIRVIAIDDGSWKLPAPRQLVERLSVEQALQKYAVADNHEHHVIVICSWMPMGTDWTALFRQYRVDEYILIGECDDGQCGDNWWTWGNPAAGPAASNEDQRPDNEDVSPTPPYTVDGYSRHNLDDLLPYQFSRFDSAMSKYGRTVSFRRGGSRAC